MPPSLCQVCIEHDCATPEWHKDVAECENFRPPWKVIECDICHTPTGPFDIQRVKVGKRTLLVCRGCVGDAVVLLIDTIEEATEKVNSE